MKGKHRKSHTKPFLAALRNWLLKCSTAPATCAAVCAACTASVDAQPGTPLLKLTGSDVRWDDDFGASVAVNESLIVVGAVGDDNGRGSVYVFDAATGHELQKIIPSGGGGGDWFGASVAVWQQLLLVGAPGDDDLGSDAGAAYLYDASTGVLLSRFVPEDGTASWSFGQSVALEGYWAAVGATGADDARGAVYVFDVSVPNSPVQMHKLRPSGAQPGAGLGTATALSGGIVVAGAPWAYFDEAPPRYGAAYVFSASTGERIHTLRPTCESCFPAFGMAVAIDGSLAVVGSPWEAVAGGFGTAYVIDVSTGQSLHEMPSAPQPEEAFGDSVAIRGNAALVGATGTPGTGYVFDAIDGDLELSLFATDSHPNFGWRVAVSSEVAVITAREENVSPPYAGAAAYVFDLRCIADMTTQGAPQGDPNYGVPDGTVTTADIQFYVNLYVTNDLAADLTTQGAPVGDLGYGVPDGLVSTADIQFYVNLYVAGCP